MKKRLRKTGEIVDVINYSAPNLGREISDYVSYIDSKGAEHVAERGLNIHWDFEDVEEELTKEIDWEEVRIKAAIGTLNGILSGDFNFPKGPIPELIARDAVTFADALIAELKKGGLQ